MKPSKPPGTRLIRNSTAECLIFTRRAGEKCIEARYEDEAVWLSQKLMATLFDVEVRTISEHLRNTFSSGELEKGSVVRNFRTTASDGFELVAVGQPGAVALDGARAVELRSFRRHVDGGCCGSILGRGVLGECSSKCSGLKNRWFG